MPNGGSDCCGTCWFNRRNQGERDWKMHADDSVEPYCDIRDRAIENPFIPTARTIRTGGLLGIGYP